MIFSSIGFILFFIFFFSSIKFLNKNQKIIIILFSLFFYSYSNLIFIFLILYLTLITFICYKKNFPLIVSIFFIISPLLYYKYSFFILKNIGFSENSIFIYKSELPLAISFITFTALAYVIDAKKNIYNEKVGFFSFLEFIVYFPHLIAGPILRAKELIPILKKKIIFENDNIKFGIILFTIGFVKKVYFADTIGSIIDPIFLNPNLATHSELLKGFLLFPLQIYFDFSGYVDMALGTSNIFSINLPINFNKPYLTMSLSQFWRNWHITLSTWFRDYLYIPIGGSKKGVFRTFLNLIITMSIAGLWHGANFNFIIWGFLNGLILFFEKKFFQLDSLNKSLRVFINCFLIFNLWLIFRIQNLDFLLDYVILLYSNIGNIISFDNLLILFFTIFSVFIQKFDNYFSLKKISKKIKLKYFLPISIGLIISGLSFVSGGSDKFIYFNF